MKDIESRTYYELLGLEPDVSTETIKEAYREIARIYHPDSNFYDDIIEDTGPEDSDVFKSITAAYQVLINEDKRRAYDQSMPKGLESWDASGVDEGSHRFAGQTAADDDNSQGPRGSRDEDIPEEWRKEREYFEEHYEEILKPAPKVNLTSGGAGSQLQTVEELDPFAGWEAEQTKDLETNRFGSFTNERLSTPMVDNIPLARRAVTVSTTDPLNLLLFLGMPVMFVVVVIEVIIFHT